MRNAVRSNLSVASLESQVEEATNAVLSAGWRIIQDEAKAMREEVSDVDADSHNGRRALYTCQCLAR